MEATKYKKGDTVFAWTGILLFGKWMGKPLILEGKVLRTFTRPVGANPITENVCKVEWKDTTKYNPIWPEDKLYPSKVELLDAVDEALNAEYSRLSSEIEQINNRISEVLELQLDAIEENIARREEENKK